MQNYIHCITVKWTVLFCFAPREARFLSDGHHQKPLHIGSSHQPVTRGAMGLSSGKWCLMEKDRTGRCPTRMWVYCYQSSVLK